MKKRMEGITVDLKVANELWAYGIGLGAHIINPEREKMFTMNLSSLLEQDKFQDQVCGPAEVLQFPKRLASSSPPYYLSSKEAKHNGHLHSHDGFWSLLPPPGKDQNELAHADLAVVFYIYQ